VGDDRGDTGLPASIEMAWGIRDRPAKGPRRGLSLERIVAAGIAVANQEGLAAVSMGRIAAELGAATMSLYRYVGAKDELLALMVDTALGPPPPSRPRERWRAGLTRWADAERAAFQRNLWALRVPVSGPPITPNSIRWLESGLRTLAHTGLSEGEKLSVILLISGFVRNEATLTADISAAAPADGQVMPGFATLLRSLTTTEEFPALHAVLDSGAVDTDDDPDDEYLFGLSRILDGVDALVTARAPRRR
jgi:AcrR family transcriptional regulator